MTGSSATLLLARCGAADIVAVAHYPFHALEVRVKNNRAEKQPRAERVAMGSSVLPLCGGQQAAPLRFGVC